MKSSFLAVAAVLAGVSSAQNGLPSCAQACVLQYTTGSTIAGCSNINVACICANPTFLSSIACCLAGACNEADQQAAVLYAQNLCKTAGVTNLPAVVSCASSASTGAPTESTSSSASGAAVVSTTSSPAVTSSTPSTSPSSSSTPPPSSKSTSAAATTATSAAPASTSAASTKNAASPQNVAGVGAGIVGGLAALVAML